MGRKLLLGLLLLAPLAFYPLLRNPIPPLVIPPHSSNKVLSEEQQMAMLALTALPGHSFPAALPWESMRRIGANQSDEMDKLVQTDSILFLEKCLERYKRDVHGYRCHFAKQEKVQGKLREPELLLVNFREKPFSVHMHWKEGQDKAIRSMWVEGKNDSKLVARPLIFGLEAGFIVYRPLDGLDVKMTSRFGINTFGMYKGAEDTLKAIKAAKAAGTLHLKYHGIETVEKAGNRLCYKLVRTPYDPPESGDEQLNELTIYIDRATLMQVGSILKNTSNEFIAEYFFRDIELNPTFDEKQFTDKAI